MDHKNKLKLRIVKITSIAVWKNTGRKFSFFLYVIKTIEMEISKTGNSSGNVKNCHIAINNFKHLFASLKQFWLFRKN